jgi:hypothetical protein
MCTGNSSTSLGYEPKRTDTKGWPVFRGQAYASWKIIIEERFRAAGLLEALLMAPAALIE